MPGGDLLRPRPWWHPAAKTFTHSKPRLAQRNGRARREKSTPGSGGSRADVRPCLALGTKEEPGSPPFRTLAWCVQQAGASPRARDRHPLPAPPRRRPPARRPPAQPGRDLGTRRPQLRWALGLDLGDAILCRPAPPRPPTGVTHRVRPSVLARMSSGSWGPPGTPRRVAASRALQGRFLGFGLPLQATGDSTACSARACFLLLRRKRYLESSPYRTHARTLVPAST